MSTTPRASSIGWHSDPATGALIVTGTFTYPAPVGPVGAPTVTIPSYALPLYATEADLRLRPDQRVGGISIQPSDLQAWLAQPAQAGATWDAVFAYLRAHAAPITNDDIARMVMDEGWLTQYPVQAATGQSGTAPDLP